MINNPGPPLFSVVPTGSPSSLQLLPLSMITGDIVGPESVIYVEPPAPDGRGSAAGARGNAAMPFATLDQAIAAAVAVLPAVSSFALAPGTYAPPSTTIPDGMPTGVLYATTGLGGEALTIIDGTGTGLPCWDLSKHPRNLWLVGAGIRMQSDPGVPSVKADGTAAPAGSFFTGGALVISGTLTGGGAVDVSYAGLVILEQCEIIGSDPWNWTHVAQAFVGFGVFSPSLTLNAYYDADAPNVPPIDQARIFFFNATSIVEGTIKIGAQLGIIALAGVTLPDIITDNNHPPSISVAAPPRFPTIQLQGGSHATRVVARGGAFPGFPDTAIDLGLQFSGASIDNGFQVAIETSPVVNRQSLRAVGTVIATPGGGIEVGQGIDLDFTGGALADMTGGQLQTTGAGADEGTVKVPPFATLPLPAAALANTIPFPFKLQNSGYSAIAESDDVTTLPTAVTARTQKQCVANVTNAAGTLRVVITPDIT